MSQEVRGRINVLEHEMNRIDDLEVGNIMEILDSIIWVVQQCTVPQLRYYSALNVVLEFLSRLYELQKLDRIKDLLSSAFMRILERLLVIIVKPHEYEAKYRFASQGKDFDPNRILETVKELCLNSLGVRIKELPMTASKVATVLIYTLTMIILSGMKNSMKSIPSRLAKNLNNILRKLYGNLGERILTFNELIELVVLRRAEWNSIVEILRLISRLMYEMNYVVELLLTSIDSRDLQNVEVNELKIDEFPVSFEDRRIMIGDSLYRFLKLLEARGRSIASAIKNYLSAHASEIPSTLRPFLDGLVNRLEDQVRPVIINSLEHNFTNIIELSENSRLGRLIVVILSLLSMRHAIMRALFSHNAYHRIISVSDRGEERVLQIICLGLDDIVKNIMSLPIYHSDGYRYSVFSHGAGVIDVDPKASRVFVIRYMYPKRQYDELGVSMDKKLTIYDLYRGNIGIPWIEFRLDRIVSPRGSIYLQAKSKNIYEGHIEFESSSKWAPFWNPGRLTLLAYMLLTSPIYEKMISEGIVISEMSIDVRYFGPPDIYDYLVIPELCNHILQILWKAMEQGQKRIIILAPLAEEMHFRFLMARDNKGTIIHVDLLPIILEASETKERVEPISLLHALKQYINKYRLELIDAR